ncbi:ABC-type multidrug transport system, ATPase and permease component [Opitutaceae bacterium TAV1]|nr:ABC-type multidrug transport system, ATPase and permease component [Opitutaceae bacterium TAV1]
MSTAKPSAPGAPDRPDRLLTVHKDSRTETDEAQFKPLQWSLIRRMFGYTRHVAAKRNWLIFLTLCRAMQLPALTWLMSVIIAGPIARHEWSTVIAMLFAYGGLALVTEGMFHFRQRFALEIGETVVNRLRSEVFDAVQRQPMSFFHRTKLGRILSRMTSDVDALRTGIQDVFFVSIVQVGQMSFAALVMLWTDWKMFLVVAGLAPILWGLNRRFRVRLSRYSRASQESFSRVTATLAESVNGIRVTQGFVRQETNAGLFRQLLSDHSQHNINLARTSAVLTPILELNSQLFISVLLMLGGWRAFSGAIGLEDLITFFFVANLFFSPIQVIANQYNQALIAMASAERVFRLIDLKPEWTDAPDARDLPVPPPVSHPSHISHSSHPLAPPPPPAPPGLRIEFRNVTFGYNPEVPVLRDITFTAEPGQTIALVGHTGSGKSSIINLVSKFYLPTSGELRIDGRDIHTITGHSLHRQTGMVTQQNFLFSGTVLDNILMARPEATEDDVRAAAASIDCLDLLDALPGGLRTEVGAGGGGISLGQRQLVCFTRAMLADPRLVILDEATSAIDALTEARLQRALQLLLCGRTSIVVAHRLSTIRYADLVLVLDQGRIIESGTHDQLVAAGGAYASLHGQFAKAGGTAGDA